jgi:hypothetical protein
MLKIEKDLKADHNNYLSSVQHTLCRRTSNRAIAAEKSELDDEIH